MIETMVTLPQYRKVCDCLAGGCLLYTSVSTSDLAAKYVMDTVAGLKTEYPEVHCICGSVSYTHLDVYKRQLMNRS